MPLTVAQAAQLLRVDEDLVYDWIRNENLPSNFYGERYYINKVKLLDWAHRNQFPLPLEGSISEPILENAFSRGVYLTGSSVADFQSAVHLLLTHAFQIEEGALFYLFEMVSCRKNFGWGTINQYAVPLPDSPLIRAQEEASVHLLLFPAEIPWLQDQIKLLGLWLIVTPVSSLHVNLVTRVSYVLHDTDFASLLKKKVSKAELLERMKKMSRSETIPNLTISDARGKQ